MGRLFHKIKHLCGCQSWNPETLEIHKNLSKENSIVRLMAEILHQLIGRLFHYLQASIYPSWCKISSINRISWANCDTVWNSCKLLKVRWFWRMDEQHPPQLQAGTVTSIIQPKIIWSVYGGFLKWWYPTTMGFPAKNDHFGGVLGVPPF